MPTLKLARKKKDILIYIDVFMSFRNSRDNGLEHRYASFDYCYGYFKKLNKKMGQKNFKIDKYKDEISKQLMIFMASWGMLRGSSVLLQKSLKYFERFAPLIYMHKDCFEIDIKDYNKDEKLRRLKNLYSCIKCMYNNTGVTPTPTNITKLMLGVFGCVPAFDDYFRKACGISGSSLEPEKFASNLEQLLKYYKIIKSKIPSSKMNIKVLDYKTGKETNLLYKKSKVIDMIGFVQVTFPPKTVPA